MEKSHVKSMKRWYICLSAPSYFAVCICDNNVLRNLRGLGWIYSVYSRTLRWWIDAEPWVPIRYRNHLNNWIIENSSGLGCDTVLAKFTGIVVRSSSVTALPGRWRKTLRYFEAWRISSSTESAATSLWEDRISKRTIIDSYQLMHCCYSICSCITKLCSNMFRYLLGSSSGIRSKN
jgi:hypothetical protein